MKIAAATFGCKQNQYETSCIMDDFLSNGWEQAGFSEQADVYLINSCTVTNRTDFKSRNAIRKALKQKQQNPKVKIVVTGCYAQRNEAEIKQLGDIDLVIDNNHKNRIFAAVTADIVPEFQDILKVSEYSEHSTKTMLDHSRAFLKIQDGCDFFCAYCAVAWARGPSRSRKRDNIIKQVKMLVEHGFQEFVLSGINLGLYGFEKDDNYHLEHLLIDLEKIEGVEKLRLSSIEPQLFTEPLLEQIENSKQICPHFHIPLQSGSDTLLKSMGRHYDTSEFAEVIGKLLKLKPDAAIGMDVIVGLPGETDALFEETYSFLQKLPLTYLHVFPYSRRPGTKAWSMPDQVNGTISKKRVKRLIALSDTKKSEYINHLISRKTILSGIVEKQENGYYTLLSDHYIRAYCQSENIAIGHKVIGKTIKTLHDGVLIELI